MLLDLMHDVVECVMHGRVGAAGVKLAIKFAVYLVDWSHAGNKSVLWLRISTNEVPTHHLHALRLRYNMRLGICPSAICSIARTV